MLVIRELACLLFGLSSAPWVLYCVSQWLLFYEGS